MTVSLSSNAVFFGSVASILVDDATRTSDRSGVTATFCGGPTTEFGAGTSARIRGELPRISTKVTVSGGPLATVVLTPSTRVTLASLAETTSCARARRGKAKKTAAPSATAVVNLKWHRFVMAPDLSSSFGSSDRHSV